MQAWVFKTKGKPADVLRKVEDWPKPTPQRKQVLVKVHATSLNPIGWKAMGVFPLSGMSKVPAVPEADVAGVVAGGDLEGSGFALGDEVFGQVPYDVVQKTGVGALAEYTLVEPTLLVHKPKNISFEDAASFPLAGLTAFYNLARLGGLKKGQEGEQKRVFINGGSGGVGAYAIQLAKILGAYVVTTCSNESKAFVESLNPDEVINYKEVDLARHLTEHYASKPFDFIFDTVGVDLYTASPKYLKAGGPYLDIAGPHMDGTLFGTLKVVGTLVKRMAWPRLLGGTPRKYRLDFFPAATMGPELKQAAGFFEEGSLKPMIDQVYSFDDVHKAYERQMSARSKGKVVVKVVA